MKLVPNQTFNDPIWSNILLGVTPTSKPITSGLNGTVFTPCRATELLLDEKNIITISF